MFIRKKFCKSLFILFAAAFVLCTNSFAKESASSAKASASEKASVQKATLTKEKPRFFWKISGVDKMEILPLYTFREQSTWVQKSFFRWTRKFLRPLTAQTFWPEKFHQKTWVKSSFIRCALFRKVL